MGYNLGSIVKKATNTATDVAGAVTGGATDVLNTGLEGTSEALQELGTPNLPNTPQMNTPDMSHGTSMLTGGINKLGEGINFAVGGAGNILNRNLNELAKLGKEAISGQGGYSDDAPGEGPGPGPTGFEAATQQTTMLTGQRKQGSGRKMHAGSGSASKIS